MQMYCFEDPTFEGSREQNLVAHLIECMNDKNRDEFALAVSEFNQITPFNKLKTSLIVRIKETSCPEDKSHILKDDEDIDLTGGAKVELGSKPAAQNEEEDEIDFT